MRSAIPMPYVGEPLVQVASDAGALWVPAADEVMVPYLRSRGNWEPEVGQLLLERCRADSTFVDVGASFGYFTRLVARRFPTAKIHAFEPHPQVARILELNVWQAGTPNVTVWPVALGDERGTVSVETVGTNIGDTRVSAALDEMASMVAPVTRLDDVIDGPVDLMKIDVQGYEPNVIRGMVRIARENPGLQIVLEYWPSAARARGLDPLSTLETYRLAGFDYRAVVSGALVNLSDREILNFCDTAGRAGEATLVLQRSDIERLR